MKRISLLLLLIFCVPLVAQTDSVEQPSYDETSVTPIDEATDDDDILAYAESQHIETPQIEPSCAAVIKMRSLGISFLYKYHNVKNWLLSKRSLPWIGGFAGAIVTYMIYRTVK